MILKVFTSMKYLLLIVFFSSCAAKKSGISWGGGSALPDEKVENINLKITGAASDQVFMTKNCTDTPKRSSRAEMKRKKIREALGFAVDTVPPPAFRNKADIKLAKAEEVINKYAKVKSNRGKGMLIYFLITALPVGFILTLLVQNMGYGGILQQILWILVAISVVTIWLVILLALFSRAGSLRRKAYRLILNSPEQAPAERRIEYKVRALLMLNSVMDRKEQIRRIRKIKELGQVEPYNPWLKRLEELRYYQDSLTNVWGGFELSPDSFSISVILGLLLIPVLKWFNR